MNRSNLTTGTEQAPQSQKTRLPRLRLAMTSISIILISLVCSVDRSEAADIKVIPSALRVSPGESFYIDINVENIPSEGLGAVQFRLNIVAQGSNVSGVSDTSQGKATDVSVSAPLLIGLPTANRSAGIGDFFLNAAGPNGILVMDNEPLVNGSALYTFGHTNGSTPQSGGGSVARFHFAVGKDVAAEKILITLSDVMLLDTGVMYPLDTNTGATIELRCITKVPNLLGLSRADAQAALLGAGLLIGNIYEIDNQNKAYTLNQALTQSYAAGTSVLCETPVDLAINTAPSEVGGASAADKPNDESGGAILSWTPSASSDTAGYRVYLGMQLLSEIRNPSSTGTEISGLPIGQVSQVKITSFDSFGNESSGVTVSANAVDDIAPRITIDGVVEGAFYSSSVLPSISVIDSNLSAKEILLNGISYAMAAIGIEGNYTLKVTATDSSGNTTTKEIYFVIDKTPPSIVVSGVEKNRYYNTDITPVITVTEPNLQTAEFLLNGSPFTSGSVITAEGSYELKVDASDKAGNHSTDTYAFYIDKTKPSSALTVGEPKFTGSGNTYVSGVTGFTISGEDKGVILSGIDRLEYRIHNGLWSKYQSPFNLAALADGVIAIDYRAIDMAGNIEDNHTLTVNADNTPPLTDITVSEPKFSSSGSLYVKGNTAFTLTATDAFSGVSKTEYRIDGGQWLNYAAFALPSEGAHIIGFRSADNLGNAETEKTIEVITDNTPPVSSVNIGAPQYSVNGNTYIGGNTEITITASDAGSGTGRIEYSIDGSAFAIYGSAITLSAHTEGAHVITYRSIDNLGNTEADKTLYMIVDNTPPSTTISVGEPKFIGSSGAYFVTKDTVVTLSASDNLSGISKTEYRIDAGEWVPYNPFKVDTEGSHTISYRSSDNLGNIETEKILSVIIDNTPPVTEITAGEPKFNSPDGKLYVSGKTVFTLVATDSLSGVSLTEYRIDSGAWQSYSPFAINAEGSHFIEFRSKDNVGNQELTKSLSIIVDNTPPSTEISIGEPKYIDSSGALYVTKDTIFTLGASDNLSGISVTEYKINTGEWTLYAQFKLNAEGMHTVYYRSKDNVGNIETEKVLTAVIDNTPPLSEITISAPKYIGQSGKTYATKDALFTITAIDSASGVAKTEYRLDNGVWITYAPFSIPSEGEHTIEFRSTDNVGNVEAIKALSIVIDNTPPVTEITLGEPKHTSSDGTLYVSGNTTFTLTSSDNLSGVSKTEYRIDSGQWQAYTVFTITSEGTHTIGFRSIDNLGNTETEKTLSIILDNTSPSTNISVGDPKHQTGENLYISGSTEITISAVDTGSGIGRIEYNIDSSSFTSYISPITFASYTEGSHTISYRSIDNLGTTEDAKTLIVIVDKTPPQTAITASDTMIEGVINTVSPKTRFTFSSSDNLSGVKDISYKIDGGAWQPYLANFSLSGLAAGAHTITYKAMDNVLNEEIEKTITVRLIVIDVQKGLSSEQVVLAGVWTDENGSDTAQKQADMNNLNSILSSLGLSYYMAPGNEEFVEAVRSGRYNTYLLVDYKEPLLGEEIRESVYYGSGLIFIKTSPQADPFLDDVFGVKFTGKTTNSDLTVNLVKSPISAGGTINSSGKGVVSTITSDTAQSFGYVVDKRDTFDSLVSNQYGRGKTILYNFDLLYTTDRSLLTDLISNSLNYVKPIEQYPTALESMSVKISVDNSTEPVDIKLIETIPAGTSADSISPNASVTGNTITWQKYLNIREKAAFRYYLNIPDASGDYTTDTELRYSNNGEYRLYGNYTLTFNIQNSSAELLRTIMSELSGLSANNTADADRITKAVADISVINVNASSRKDAEENIKLITNATDEIRKLSFDISDVRLKLDELLRIWEKKWYLMKQ